METAKLLSLRSLSYAWPLLEIGAIVVMVAALPFSDKKPVEASLKKTSSKP